jgi:hypothetical protein
VILQQREVQNVIKHGAKSKFKRRNCERADNKRLISHTWLLIRARAAATHPRNVLHNLRYEYKFLNCPRVRPPAPTGVVSRFAAVIFFANNQWWKNADSRPAEDCSTTALDLLKNSSNRPPSHHNKLHLFLLCGAWMAGALRRYYTQHDGKLNCWHIFTRGAIETASWLVALTWKSALWN